MSFLQEALRSRYLVSIREEKGGTYGVQVGGSLDNSDGLQTYELQIAFDTNEQMADELSEIVVAELKKIAEQGPLTEDVEKTREFLLKDWGNRLQKNNVWLNYISLYDQYGADMNFIGDFERVAKEMNGEQIKALAAKILADGNMAYIVMRPAK